MTMPTMTRQPMLRNGSMTLSISQPAMDAMMLAASDGKV